MARDKYLDVACPTCAQQPGERCKSYGGQMMTVVHSRRIEASQFVRDTQSGVQDSALVDEAIETVVSELI